MEVWTLNHPELGRIAAEFGYDPEFAAREVAWPGSDEGDILPVTAESSPTDRLQAAVNNPALRLQVSVDGEVVGRYAHVRSGRVPLGRQNNPLEFREEYMVADRTKPHLKVDTSVLREPVNVEFREGTQVEEFDPPAGSRGGRRRDDMERSPVRRVLYPMAAGLGKSGWALAALFLGPVIGRIVGRIVEWLSRFLPDVEIAMPAIHLPVPEIPEIRLPVPSISVPALPPLPEVPEWVKVAAEYQKLWVPILIALIVAVVAVRNHSASERKRREWEERRPE